MVLFPNAKINLGLNILGKRPDGYHDIETVFCPVGLSDALEIIVAGDGKFEFTNTGLLINGNSEDNLCVKACRLLSQEFHLPPVRIRLHKVIPPGSGLGGGSSDGAFTIKLLNTRFSLGLSDNVMREYASKLGSDCPFFIDDKPAFASGKGDQFGKSPVDLSGYIIIIVVPPIQVNTTMAYSKVTLSGSPGALKDIVARPVTQWKDHLQNDFERSVFPVHPRIMQIKQQLYDQGAIYASMSGSGSAVYGIFGKMTLPSVSFPDCFIWQGKS